MPVDARTEDLRTALRTTGAVREFRDEPVPHETVRRLLDIARFAPSGGNTQPWRVILVEDPQARADLSELVVSVAQEYAALRAAGQRPFGLTDHGRWPGPGEVDLDAARRAPLGSAAAARLTSVPVVLLVLVHLGSLAAMDAELERHGIVGGASIYPFCRDILLAARLEGLGGVLTTFAARREPDVLARFEVPDGYAVAAVLSLGVPQHQPSRLNRRPVDDFATVDRFDGPTL
jgi:nitroreductase